MKLAALTAFLLSGSIIAGQAPKRAQAPFMLGVLKQDGAMQPLFHYAQGTWTTPWPRGTDTRPASLRAVPAAWWPGFSSRGWVAHLPDLLIVGSYNFWESQAYAWIEPFGRWSQVVICTKRPA
jgi:hypothetical protein